MRNRKAQIRIKGYARVQPDDEFELKKVNFYDEFYSSLQN